MTELGPASPEEAEVASPTLAIAPWTVALEELRRGRDDFEARVDQRTMIEAVATALQAGDDLVVEAGTGTGKTLGYLLPLLGAGHRAVISTATRQLQAQVLESDLPAAMRATGSRAVVAVLKGRANYLCHDRVHRLASGALSARRGGTFVQDRVIKALATSPDGDIAAIEGVAEDDAIWPDVTSTSESCLGSDCHFVRDCFVLRARRAALEADVVVVNHHVLLADYALRERWEGAGLLPSTDAIVIDEAHALEDVVAHFFGRTVSSRRLDRLVEDLSAGLDAVRAPPTDDARLAVGALQSSGAALFLAARGLPAPQRIDDDCVGQLRPAREAMIEALGRLWVALAGHIAMQPTLAKLREAVVALEADLLEVVGDRGDPGAVVRWVEARERSVALRSQPVRVAPILQRTLLAEPAPRLFCSATLAVGADFGPFLSQLGLPPAVTTLRLEGPFDYPSQAMLYIADQLPDPFAPGRDAAVAEAIAGLVACSGGGAFALFSSHRGLQDAWQRLYGRLGVPMLRQGEMGRQALLERFRQEQPAVLFATMGFWQGVDVPGDALRLVILDKIPFPPPDDPVFAARASAIDSEGGRSFAQLSIPAAATALRQGFGRLIRRGDDRGVVAILDPRLHHKPYGRRLVSALPPARRARSMAEVAAFFSAGTATE